MVVFGFILLIQEEIVEGTILDGMIFEFWSAFGESQSLLETVLVTSFNFEGLATLLSMIGDLRIKLLAVKSDAEIVTGLVVLLEAVFMVLLGDKLWMSNFPTDFGEELKFKLSFTGVGFLRVGDGETVLAAETVVVVVTGEALVSFTTDADFALER